MKENKTVKEWIESDKRLSKKFYVVPDEIVNKYKKRRKNERKR